MPLSEKQIETNILSFLEEIGVFAWKNNSNAVYDPTRKVFRKAKSRFILKGVADILGLLPSGNMLAIEVKSKIGRPSPEQLRFIATIQKHGGIAFISRSVMQTFEQLRHFLKDSDNYINIARRYELQEELYGKPRFSGLRGKKATHN